MNAEPENHIQVILKHLIVCLAVVGASGGPLVGLPKRARDEDNRERSDRGPQAVEEVCGAVRRPLGSSESLAVSRHPLATSENYRLGMHRT